ncbi:fatty acid synthase subunit beta dehydratase [Coccidioides immitis H538.4]|uniref:fatty-acyl-CoA synthase system n=1 Tax=Coccidioides immitis H538.4 TaxID=396776 RepID=A0A0J8S2N7_COCIT|nr:fatty acid synthase subunit beta dehydratase [Coccidioides immitis H538.4]
MSHDQDIRWTFKSLGEEKDLLISYFTSLRGSAQSADLIPTFSSHDDICLSLNQTLALLDFISTNPPDDTILQLLHRAFKCELLCGGDIHSLALKLEPSSSRKLIEAYFRTIGRFREMSTSALFERANIDDISLLAVFGGQGIHNLDCLTELRNIYHTYKPLIGDFIQRAALNLQNIALRCSDSADGPFYAKLDIHDWLFGPSEKCPGREHIATAPISFPINGLTSFSHYAIACHVLNLHPGEMRVRFSGAAGHSQGVIVAAAIAGSDSWSRFHDLVDRSLELLFWIGLKSHQSFNHSVLQPAVVSSDGNQNAVAHSMLSIRGMRKVKLQELLQQSNSCLGESEAAYLSLQNSDDAFVVAGPTKTLRGICQLLEKRKVAPNESQAKIPFPDRAPNIDYQLLPISAPFHSPHLQNVTQEVLQQVGAELLAELDLRIPVYHTRTGADLRDITGTDLTAELVRMITCEQVFWREACLKDDITHIIDFGPGRSSCLLLNQIQGSGTRIILVSEPTDSTSLTPMTEIFGTPPVMVGGMTPTTVAPRIRYQETRDIYNGHIEGITLNVIYANPKGNMVPISLDTAKWILTAFPVEGLTIGAGIPSLEVASEYIHTLGLKHISFKPGSVDAIDQVIKIAEANESFPIALQWTGGRGGGHHSYEDVHAPILKTYARIRKRKNIILIIGSGFGDAQGMLPYLTGSWSETFDYPPMPFDGVLLGSRMMVSKEAHTSPRVKDLIVQTKGTSDADWFATYSGSAGGVITVKSEMGEPIHKLATRAVLLWNDLDRTVFRIKEPAKRLEALLARRESIISRLNTDYCRPWFAIDSSGNAVELEDLTYGGCLLRVVNLMYLPQQRRWVHPSYLRFFLDFLRRVEERLCHSTSSVVAKESSNPFKLVDSLHRDCPMLSTELIYPEDVSYFLALCRRRGQKPVNFIPRLDENFEEYFKKDSLWQMENLEAVIDQDPQRVCIIHGPVAAKYSTSTEESAGQILDGICNDLLSSLASGQHENRENLTALSKTPTEQPLAGIFPCASFTSDQMHNVYTFTSSVTDIERNRILEHALGGVNQWLQACFSEQYIRRANIQEHNPLPIAFRPVTGDALIVRYHGSTRQEVGS